MKRMIVAFLFVLPTVAEAGACEENFKAIGDPRNGMLYVGSVNKPGLTIRSALGQMQKIGKDEGYVVGAEAIEGDVGELYLTQTASKPPIVVEVEATASGSAVMGIRLAPGQNMEKAAATQTICGMLNRLKTGKEGNAIADAGRAESGADKVIDAEAPELSAQIMREVQTAMRPVQRKGVFKDFMLGSQTNAGQGELDAALLPVRAKYMGRKYRIDGQIYTVTHNQFKDEMVVSYLVTQTRGFVRQNASLGQSLNYTITCFLANDQAALFSTLRNGGWVKLEGTVDTFNPRGMLLRNCRQAD